MVENTDAILINLLLSEITQGFLHIQEVYALINDHEIIDFTNISALFGIYEYDLSEEQVYDTGDGIITWHFLDLSDNELTLDSLEPNGIHSIFASQTGQVLYVFYSGAKFLLIDLGSAEKFGRQPEEQDVDEVRAYFMVRIF